VPPSLADAPATPLAESLARLEQAVSPLTGIVRDVSQLMHGADEPRLAAFGCTLASGARTVGSQTVEVTGSAKIDPDRARAASIGEAIERYSASVVPPGLQVTTAGELGERAVDPARFALFHRRQFVPGFPFEPFTRSTRLAFVEGFSLADGSPAYLPAQLAYLTTISADEPLVCYPTSNGLACGATLAEAVLAGLLELVERDAMMISWSNRLSLPRLAWHDDPAIAAVDARVFAPTGLRYHVVDTSVFFDVPATIAVVEGAPGEPATVAFGAGCAPTIEEAWRTSLAEAFSVRRWLGEILHAEPDRRVVDAREVRTFDDHMVFYADPERARAASFLWSGPDRLDTRDVAPLAGVTPKERIDEVVRRLDARGVSAYAVDVTSPDVEELGLKVAHVVAPELCALDVLAVAPYRGGRRRYAAAAELGLLEAPLTFDDLNPLPHPYP
jgi:ribosomal protein S12 methylthiotransferase accessory factor